MSTPPCSIAHKVNDAPITSPQALKRLHVSTEFELHTVLLVDRLKHRSYFRLSGGMIQSSVDSAARIGRTYLYINVIRLRLMP